MMGKFSGILLNNTKTKASFSTTAISASEPGYQSRSNGAPVVTYQDGRSFEVRRRLLVLTIIRKL